jgi:hypothetical protein
LTIGSTLLGVGVGGTGVGVGGSGVGVAVGGSGVLVGGRGVGVNVGGSGVGVNVGGTGVLVGVGDARGERVRVAVDVGKIEIWAIDIQGLVPLNTNVSSSAVNAMPITK